MTPERRAWPRLPCSADHFSRGVYVRPGREVQMVDVSRGGALIEGRARLAPAATIELRFSSADKRLPVRGRVVRAYVSSLSASHVVYRAAIAFEEQMNDTQLARIRADDG